MTTVLTCPLPQMRAYPLKSGVPVRIENSNSNSEISHVSFDSSGNPLHDYKKRSYHNPLAHISKTHFYDKEKTIFLESTQSEVC
jgi:hypothetical protein